jgi:DNA polymerase V
MPMNIVLLAEHEAGARFAAPCHPMKVPAGFPSPAADYVDRRLDLNELLVKHPAATFYCEFSGNSLNGIGIHDGDLGVVDRSLQPQQGDVVIALIDGAMTAKILDIRARQLLAAHPDYPAIPIGEAVDLLIEGVVVHAIRSFRVRAR